MHGILRFSMRVSRPLTATFARFREQAEKAHGVPYCGKRKVPNHPDPGVQLGREIRDGVEHYERLQQSPVAKAVGEFAKEYYAHTGYCSGSAVPQLMGMDGVISVNWMRQADLFEGTQATLCHWAPRSAITYVIIWCS